MELNGIIGALFLSCGIGWLFVRNPSLATALLAFSLPFDQQVIREDPLTVYTTEALVAGLVAGWIIRRRVVSSRVPDSDGRIWVIPFLVLAGWCAAFPGALDKSDAVKSLARWAELWLVLAVLALLIRSREADARVVAGGYLAGVGLAGIMVLREFVVAPMLSRPSGPISPNSIPPYMGLGLLLLVTGVRPRFGRADRFIAWGIGILLTASLIASQSRTGIAASLAGVLVCLALLGWPARKALLASLTVVAILLGYAASRDWRVLYRLSTYPEFYKSPAFLERVEIYRLGERIWKERPILGAGPGCYSLTMGEYFGRNPRELEVVNRIPLMYSDIQSHVHNLFLQIAIEVGAIGLGFWLGALVVLGFLLGGVRRLSPLSFAGGMGLMAVFVLSNMLDITITHSRGVLYAVGWGIFLGIKGSGKKRKGRAG